jgi:hypothetical protein
MGKRPIGTRAMTDAERQRKRRELFAQKSKLSSQHWLDLTGQIVGLLDEVSALMHLHGVDVRSGDGLSIDAVIDAVQDLEAAVYDVVWPGKILTASSAEDEPAPRRRLVTK